MVAVTSEGHLRHPGRVCALGSRLAPAVRMIVLVPVVWVPAILVPAVLVLTVMMIIPVLIVRMIVLVPVVMRGVRVVPVKSTHARPPGSVPTRPVERRST